MAKELTLGITKIGDLLLQNRITQIENGKEPLGIVLRIPKYQRPYKWTGKNVNQLFDDILFAKNENKEIYRVGTLILHYDSKEKCHNIVDGQQRTISFALLLHALGAEPIAFMNQELTANPYNTHNVQNNYRAILRRINGLTIESNKELREYIENNCELIVVITENESEAFQFFDSQNARGKKLYPHDLLKAYHLREMNNYDVDQIEKVVKTWEDMNQRELSDLFTEYLYRLKEWINGNKALELDEHNIDLFKGVTASDNYPYAQYYKGAFAYADNVNHSTTPFVTGLRTLRPFQLNTPIVAGKPFFDYAKHYFDVLADIQNNDKYEGYLINDNEIVKTLNLRHYRNGVGNRITRLLFDTSVLLYADRFCPEIPSKNDLDLLGQFLIYAFVWAYSMRAQYANVGWLTAQNYIMGTCNKEGIINAFNLYKTIAEADSPMTLLSVLADKIMPLSKDEIKANKDNIDEQDEETGIYQNYLHFFAENDFYRRT
ncbi:MAG: DUF262 domain-containing protein [Clostridia bacterium]|nr:DUF262 domain-containing protein [Clostridia bacterium]